MSEEQFTPPAEQSTAPSPADSGTKLEQKESSITIAGELMSKPQLSQIADCVNEEASGLITVDPASLRSLGAIRLMTSYMNEQAVSTAALRKGLADTQERERA